MQGDINVPKTKSVNIFLQFIKMFVYVLTSIFVAQGIISEQAEICSTSGLRLADLNVIGSVVMIIFNIITVIFVCYKDPFARLEFFVMYAINLIWSGVTLANIYIDINNEPNECQGVIMFQKATVFFTLKVHLEVLLTFFVSFPFPLRITFLPTSLLPLFIIFTSLNDQIQCGDMVMNIIFALIFVNFLVICLGVPLAFLLLCTNTSKANNTNKFVIVLSALGQMGVLSLMAVAYIHRTIPLTTACVPSVFAIKTYFIICPIAVMTSLFMLMGLKSNDDDNIRLDLLQQREKQVQQSEYAYANQRNSNIYVKPVSNNVSMFKDKSVKDNVSISYGTISKRG